MKREQMYLYMYVDIAFCMVSWGQNCWGAEALQADATQDGCLALAGTHFATPSTTATQPPLQGVAPGDSLSYQIA